MNREAQQHLCPTQLPMLTIRVWHYTRLPCHKTQPNSVPGAKQKERSRERKNRTTAMVGSAEQLLPAWPLPEWRNPEQRETDGTSSEITSAWWGRGWSLPSCWCLPVLDGAAHCPHHWQDAPNSLHHSGHEHCSGGGNEHGASQQHVGKNCCAC